MTADPQTRPPPGDAAAPGYTDAATEYQTYLCVSELLRACQPITGNRAEPIFIRLHQICELQFASILDKLDDTINHLAHNKPGDALQALRGCHILTEHSAELLARFPQLVPPEEFHDFRHALGRASGIGSIQFRRIEDLSGHAGQDPERRTLWTTFLSWSGISAQDPLPKQLAALFAGCGPRAELAHALRQHDLEWMRWRRTHAVMVETMIGPDLRGTAGTSGVAFLRRRARLSWYPELHTAYTRTHRS